MSTGADGRTTPPHRRSPVPDRLWVPAVGALALALVFVTALLVRADGDVSLLVHAAPPWTSAEAAPGSLTVQPADEGFDGQFFYRLGVDPWTTDDVVAGVTNDLPSLRNARWGYGALAWLTSAGDVDLVPWALVALNVVAMVGVGAIGGGLARSVGRHAAWGVLFAAWPGFAYSLSMDTSELVASAFALGGLLALRRRRWTAATVLLAVALITRDTMAVVPAGVVAAGAGLWLEARLRPRGAPDDVGEPVSATAPTRAAAPNPGPSPGAAPQLLVVGAAPLALFAVWQLVQRARFGQLPLTSSGDNNLSVPFGGLLDQLGQVLPPAGGEELFRLVCISGLVALLGTAGWSLLAQGRPSGRPAGWRRGAAPGAAGDGPADGADLAAQWWWIERTTWIPAVLVVVVLNAYLWSGATAFMRAATEAGLLSTWALLAARGRRADRILVLAGLGLGSLWLITAVAQFAKLG